MKKILPNPGLREKGTVTINKLKEEFQLISKVDIGSYNRKMAARESLTFIDFIYYTGIFIACLFFFNALFISADDALKALLNVALIIPFCLFVTIPLREGVRALIFLTSGAKNLQVKNKRNLLFTCIAPVVRDKELQLGLSAVPLVLINAFLVIAYLVFPAYGLMIAGAQVCYLLYSSYEVEVINIVVLNWKKKIYSYFDTENKLLIFAR